MYQSMGRSVLALAGGLLLALSSVPRCAGANSPVGSLRASGAVYVDQNAVPASSTIYNGDRLRTEEGQAVVSLPRAGTLTLERQSAATFVASAAGASVSLESGRLSFLLSTPALVRVEANGIVFNSLGAFPSLGEVAFAGDGSIRLALRQGSISVGNLTKEPVVVKAGQVLTISPPAAQQDQVHIGTGSHAKPTLGERLRTFRIGPLSHAASAVVVGGIVGGVVATGIVFVAASPSTP